jgi:hypothetical protein
MNLSRPLRRLALALVAFAWAAQQLGFAAHGEMQRRMAAGGGMGEICTAAGLARAPADAPAPAGNGSAVADLCDVCAGATLLALGTPAPLPSFGHALAAPSGTAGAAAPASSHPQSAHRPRAPPALLS